eukprot:gene49968-61164_t
MLLLRATTSPGLALVDRSGYFTNVSSYASGAVSLFDTDPYSFLSEGSFYINGNTGPFLTFPGATFVFNWVSEGMTVETWVRVSSVSNDIPGLMGAMSTSSCLNYWSFGPTRRTDGTIKLMLWYWPGYGIRVVGNIAISPNRWTHIAFSVVPNGQIRLFVNGVLDVSIRSVSHSTLNIGFGVGRYCTSATFFNGYVSNMRVVRGATLYTGSFTPSARPLATTASTLMLLASTSSSAAIELVDASGQYANINGFANTALPIVAEDPFSLSSESSMYIAGGSMGTPYFLSMSNSAFNF